VTGIVHATAEYLLSEQYQIEAAPGAYVSIVTSDNGAGMSPETVERIFDPFFTTKATGSGLGLAAVLGIVRSHHGTIKVESAIGRGTTFKILLPAISTQALTTSALQTPHAEPWRGRGTLLVVDDESSIRKVLVTTLEHFGFQVDEAENGLHALELFEPQPDRYAAVLLDLTMPVMNGEEAFRRMHTLHPTVKILLMSGFNRQSLAKNFSDNSLSGYLQKPFEISVLIAELRKVLDPAT
jgi:two-component system, cell cycle sensor histidine kinase and response regulator CckA